jgi:FkbM family methyltransferase
MSGFRRVLRRLPNYLRRFGAWRGLWLLYRIERRHFDAAAPVRLYQVPGLSHPVHLRDAVGDHATFWQCIVDNQYDFRRFPQAERLHASYSALVKAGQPPLIIDCGANIGLSAVWFANMFPEARIVAVEPDAANFDVLCKNVAPYGARVIPVQAAVWHEPTHVSITNPTAGAAAFRVAPVGATAAGAIATLTVPELAAMAGATTAFIVKIDIEGAQQALFSANTEWVGTTHLITLELDDWQLPWVGTSRPFFAAVSRYPFDYLLGGESIFCFRDFG